MSQEDMIGEIINFVGKHQESTASIAVFRRITGTHPGEVTREALLDLQDRLQVADPEEVESCYYMIK